MWIGSLIGRVDRAGCALFELYKYTGEGKDFLAICTYMLLKKDEGPKYPGFVSTKSVREQQVTAYTLPGNCVS